MGGNWVIISSVAILVGGLVLGAIVFFAGERNEPDVMLASVAFASPYVASGVIALIGHLSHHASYVAAAGLAVWVLTLVTFSIVVFPLLAPAVVLISSGLAETQAWFWGDWAAGALIVVGLAGSLVLLLFYDDPTAWVSPDGSAGASDVITRVESFRTLTIVTAMVAFVAAHRLVTSVVQHR